MKTIWTVEALKKLLEIEEYIARDSPERAEKFINYLIDRATRIFDFFCTI